MLFNRILVLLVQVVLLCISVKADVVTDMNPIALAGCSVSADAPLYYSAAEKVIYAFKSAGGSVTFNVTPLSGWSWDSKRSNNREMREMKI